MPRPASPSTFGIAAGRHRWWTRSKKLGPIAGLVNNAGIQASTLLALTTDETWDEILDINLGGAFRVTREVLRHMVARRRGAIVNVASLSALHGVPGHAAYAASKAGLIAMTRCVAREMGRRNIRVNAVVPGYVATDMTSDLPDSSVQTLRSGEVLPIWHRCDIGRRSRGASCSPMAPGPLPVSRSSLMLERRLDGFTGIADGDVTTRVWCWAAFQDSS